MAIKQPLADRMRPTTLDEMAGQTHLLGAGKPLRQIIEGHVMISLLLWGPPGVGKSTLAYLMAQQLQLPFEKFNASIENKAQLQKLINAHPNDSFVLLLDEIHRLTKPVQDYLLPFLENGNVLLVGTTTENPIMSITPAIRSRCQIFEFQPLKADDIEKVVQRAATDLQVQLSHEEAHAIANSGNGDVRVALNMLDTLHAMHGEQINLAAIEDFARNQHLAYDKDATQHYDYLSAFQDSVEGSDTDAALYYMAVLLEAGDLDSVIRRIKDAAVLTIGLANPERVNQIINLANNAREIGLPRATSHLTMATILLCISRRSDSVRWTYARAQQDAMNNQQHPMPTYLRDSHYKGARELRGAGKMLDAFEQPNQIAKQQYLPTNLIGHHYYVPRDNPTERALYNSYQKIFHYIYDDLKGK
ncbi:replication-associated recombination protein A [Limosilactobacillus caecicola]|uniref:replication-associated recombination protein A n=1 Tax=Limosilactobacillus caecicola TaxID=2941332 RepID=UPI00203FD4FA|nr:replication-associated recombination protein A [Limosilactobacillus caecicola]